MKPRVLVAAVLCLAVAACSFDLTRVEDTKPDVVQTPGSFYIAITANAGEPLQMQANFEPGIGADGLPRPVANDTIRIDSVAYGPTTGSLPTRAYSMMTALMSPASFQVYAPRILGEPDPAGFVLNVPGIAPVDSMIVRRGDPIEIEVEGLSPTDASLNWSWALVVGSPTTNAQVSVVRYGRMPTVLRFPAELVPANISSGYITVNVYSYEEFRLDMIRYPIRVQRQIAAVIPLRVTTSASEDST